MNNVAASKIIAMIAMLEAIGPSVEQALPNAQAILPIIEHYPDRLAAYAEMTATKFQGKVISIDPMRLFDAPPGIIY